MKNISIKIPDEIFEKVEKYRKIESKNRSSYVMEAVVEYTKKLEREELGEKLKKESLMVREDYENLKMEMKDWDKALMDIDKLDNGEK